MGKKKGNKNAGYPDDDIWADDLLQDTEAQAPEQPVAADDQEAGGFMAMVSRAKKNKKSKDGVSGTATPSEPADNEADVADDGAAETGGIKTAKQKEREKKERAKLLKKQKADEARAKQEAELRELEKSLGTASIDDAESAATSGAAKKKKNNKKKGGKADDADAPAAEAPAAKAPAAKAAEPKKEEKKDDKKKTKKKGAPIAALQKMVEQQRRMEEEMRRAEEEERKRIEEEERLAAEEEARLAAEREAKKEADRLRREQLRSEGKLLTKKQKEAKARQERQLKELLASGIQVEGLAAGKASGDAAPRRANRNEAEERKRRAAERKRQQEEEEAAKKKAEEEEAARKKAEEEAQEDGSDEEGGDWEALLESSEDEEEGDDKEEAAEDGSEEESESESESEEEEESSSDDGKTAAERQAEERKQAAAARRTQRVQEAMDARSADDLRSPICCILGHVDTGKCWGRDTPIMMADGTTRMVQHIVELDRVMGDDNTARTVQRGSVISGHGALYRVSPEEGSGADAFVCNADHVLVMAVVQRPFVVRESSKYIARSFALDPATARPVLCNHGSFDDEEAAVAALPEAKPLTWKCSVVEYLALLQEDAEVAQACKMFKPVEGVEFVSSAPSSAQEIEAAKLAGLSFTEVGQGIASASLACRKAFVAGVVEGCGVLKACIAGERGFVAGESWVVRHVDGQLLHQLRRIVRSTGLRASDVISEADGGFSLAVSGSQMHTLNALIATTDKHATPAAVNEWTQYGDSSWAFSIEELEAGEYFGFTLDGNSRVLLGDSTVSHNTKLLDKIRQTNVQAGEAGGITQQIGATYFPAEAIIKKTAAINKSGKLEIKVPGLLIIDTPGHESFTNLRSRGSSLCNIAILVVDIMHGLEPQTLESLRLLRDRKTPFIVALNKIDRMYGWQAVANNPFRMSLAAQQQNTRSEFEHRVAKTITEFAEQGLNACLYYENKNFAKYVSLVPTSAITGEGIPDMLSLIVSLTQTRMSNQLMYLSELECTVLEVKVIEGLGTTIDVVLSNGVLNEGDRIVVCGLNGPIVTTVRALLTPQPMRELRVKSAYQHHKSIKAAMGVKIAAPDLEKAIAGSRLLVVGPDDDEEELMDEIMSDFANLQDSVDKSGRGVWVQASTLGSLEALLEFLRTSKIPVAGINIGPVHKKDVMLASAMLDKAKEYAVMLCFDVKVDKDAMDMAEEMGVKVFQADIIYHLFDRFTAHHKELVEAKRKEQAALAVFPCVLRMIKGAVINKHNPLILGIDVVAGQLRLGTPLCVVKMNPETKVREIITLGKVISMEINHKPVEVVRRGESGAGVAVRIDHIGSDNPKTYGRQFDDSDDIYSRITRKSIDVLKASFRDDVSRDEWDLVVRLKKLLNVV